MTDEYIPIENLKGEMRKKKVRTFLAKAREKGSAAYQKAKRGSAAVVATAQKYVRKGREYQLKAKEGIRKGNEVMRKGVAGMQKVNRQFTSTPKQRRSRPADTLFGGFTPPPMRILPSFSGGGRKQDNILPMFDGPKRGRKRRRTNSIFDL